MVFKRSFVVFLLVLTACRPFLQPPTPLQTPSTVANTKTPSFTPTPRVPTSTQTPIPTNTPPSPTPTQTSTPTRLAGTVEPTLTFTPSPTTRPTQPTEGPGPGLVVHGYVKLADGKPVEGINMLVAFASYGGKVVAVTNSSGYYSSEYIYIPGDETIRVWAEAAGYSFRPADGSAVWTGTEFYWRHYFGFEDRSLDFTAVEEPAPQ